ncbi:MAG: sigma-54 dependent transcriptional regulator [Acidobacteriota bacterium]
MAVASVGVAWSRIARNPDVVFEPPALEEPSPVSDRARSTVLIADSDNESRRSAADALKSEGFVVAECSTRADACARLEGFAYDALIVDVRLADGDGLDVLDDALTRYPRMRCVVTAAFGSIHHAVRALKRGAVDFLIKPCSARLLVSAVRPAVAIEVAPAPVRPAPAASRLRSNHMVGTSDAMKRLLSTLELVAQVQSTVLIQGETGTGKELVARTLHDNSTRRDQPFVAFNAAAVPEGLVETELFGHVKGAFTGAVVTRAGRFEAADRGTLFIDEVSSMPLPLQAKVLRALQEREIERVGTSRPVKVNVRIVAATNTDLKEMVRAGTFREDLYYRLNVVRLELPPLRARQDDIPALAQHFIDQSCQHNDLPAKTLSQTALRMLMTFDWPGNIRHLQNAIEHAVAMSGTRQEIMAEALPEEVRTPERRLALTPEFRLPHTPEEGVNFASTMSQLERELILRYLEKAGGNKRRAARLLNLSRTTLIDKIQRLGVGDVASSAA